MKEVIVVALVPAATMFLTFITSKGSLYDNRRKWWKRLTGRGLLAVLTNLFVIVATIMLYVWSEQQNDKKNKELARSQSNMQNSIQKGIDSGNNRLFRNLSEALSKQNLKLDTVNKELVKLKSDTTRNRITVISATDPFLDFCKGQTIFVDSIYNNIIRFQIKVCNYEVASNDINVDVYLIEESQNHTLNFVRTRKIFPVGSKLPGNTEQAFPFSTLYSATTIKYYFLLYGIYYNTSHTKVFNVNTLFVYDIGRKSATPVMNPELDETIRKSLPELPKLKNK
jgi:hypothetical protein